MTRSRSVTISLSQSEINEAMHGVISKKLHAEGVCVTDELAPAGMYFLVVVDAPAVVGATEVASRADRNGDGTRLTYTIGASP